MESMGGRLRGLEKAKRGDLWGWINSKMGRRIFYMGGRRIVHHIYSTER